jgi:hypothetical protein
MNCNDRNVTITATNEGHLAEAVDRQAAIVDGKEIITSDDMNAPLTPPRIRQSNQTPTAITQKDDLLPPMNDPLAAFHYESVFSPSRPVLKVTSSSLVAGGSSLMSSLDEEFAASQHVERQATAQANRIRSQSSSVLPTQPLPPSPSSRSPSSTQPMVVTNDNKERAATNRHRNTASRVFDESSLPPRPPPSSITGELSENGIPYRHTTHCLKCMTMNMFDVCRCSQIVVNRARNVTSLVFASSTSSVNSNVDSSTPTARDLNRHRAMSSHVFEPETVAASIPSTPIVAAASIMGSITTSQPLVPSSNSQSSSSLLSSSMPMITSISPSYRTTAFGESRDNNISSSSSSLPAAIREPFHPFSNINQDGHPLQSIDSYAPVLPSDHTPHPIDNGVPSTPTTAGTIQHHEDNEEKQKIKKGDLPLAMALAVERTLLESIRSQLKMVDETALHFYFEQANLRSHLNALRRYLFMQSGDLMDIICQSLYGDQPLRDVIWWQSSNLSSMLDKCLKLTGYDKDELSSRLYFTVEALPSTKSNMRVGDSLDSLDHIKFGYNVDWPLSLILQPSSIHCYSSVFSFLLKVILSFP